MNARSSREVQPVVHDCVTTTPGRTPAAIRRLVRALLALAGLGALAALPARGDAIDRYDFSLRFPAAISRFASYGDVAAMGNAQAATEWSSSINPASAAWPHPGRKYSRALSPQATEVRFDAGTRLHVLSEALTVDAGPRGVFLPAAAQISTNHRTDRSGLGFRFDADYFQLQWGKLFTADTAVGVNFNTTFSETVLDVADTVVARSKSKSYNLRAGVVQRVAPALRFGAVLEASTGPARTDLVFFDPATGAPQAVRADDDTHQALLRLGLAWEYAPGSTFAIDWQGGVFDNDTGRLRVHRFPLGIEHQVIKDILFARIGGTLDTRGHFSGTGGLGLSLGERASVDLAYQHDMFPEIRPEFGSSATYTLSVGVSF